MSFFFIKNDEFLHQKTINTIMGKVNQNPSNDILIEEGCIKKVTDKNAVITNNIYKFISDFITLIMFISILYPKNIKVTFI